MPTDQSARRSPLGGVTHPPSSGATQTRGGNGCGEATRAAANLHTWAAVAAHDVDEVVVQRLMEGRATHYTSWERREAVRRLRLSGATYHQIIDRIGIDMRQVARDLSRYGLTRRRVAA